MQTQNVLEARPCPIAAGRRREGLLHQETCARLKSTCELEEASHVQKADAFLSAPAFFKE
jgi:hypothetical protein